MAAKKAAKKTPAKKRATGKTGGEAGGSVTPLVVPVERTDEQVAEIVSHRNDKAERWAEAWRMHAIGVPYRVIAQRMGLGAEGKPDHKEAIRYVRNHERLVDGDPERISERSEIVARLDLMAEKMLAELTRAEAAEQKAAAAAERAGKPYARVPVWLAGSDPLLKVLAQKWRVVAPHGPQKQITVELGAQVGGGGTDALDAVLARVTINEEGAA